MHTTQERMAVELSLHQLIMELNQLLSVKDSFEASDKTMLQDCREKLNQLLLEN